MNTNAFDATQLFDNLQRIEYCTTGRDLQQEIDIYKIFTAAGFDTVEIEPHHKTKEQRSVVDCGQGLLSELGKEYHTGLYIAHHPYGINRYPDFLLIINGHIIEVEAKSASASTPIFTHGDTLINPTKRNAFYVFTHITDGTEMLLPEDLISVDNYLLLLEHKKERDILQHKHNEEFNRVCDGKGEKLYYRPNIVPVGGSERTNHIERARINNLNKKVLHLLKTYQI